jgi:hypothetical protein
MSAAFQQAFLDVWQKLGRTTIKELHLGPYFSLLARLLGPVNTARIYKRLKPQNYNNMRSVSDEELEERLEVVIKKMNQPVL